MYGLRIQRELAASERRKVILTAAITPAAIAIVFWGIYVAYVAVDYLGVDLFSRAQQVPPAPAADKGDNAVVMFWIACAATPIAIAYAAYSIQRKLYFAQYGVDVMATVDAQAVASTKGLRQIWIVYEFGFETFKKKTSIADAARKDFQAGAAFHVLVDPANPESFVAYTDVFWPSLN